MTLSELFPNIKNLPKTQIKGITQNSKEIKKGYIFFAVKGHTVDGNNFVGDAVKNGAAAVITQNNLTAKYSASIIKVKNIDEIMARAATKFYDNPADKLNVIGITGTKGKTSIAYLLESILFDAQRKPAVFGTINYRINGKIFSKAVNTTPPALTLQRNIAQAVKQKSDNLIMEVSSHALELKRVEGINFNIAVFANLQRDHLDFHKNFENYFNAKRKLFENLLNSANNKTNKAAIINIDDKYARELISLLKNKVKVITYGLSKKANFTASDIKLSLDGVSFKVNGICARINLLGEHNVYNALAAIACAVASGIDLKNAIKGLSNLEGIPGRMERVDLGQNFYVFVDYAHTEEALRRALETVAPFKKRCLTVVFGCGGERDATKRPLMGATACKNADIALITKDNPRREDPNKIFMDILRGIPNRDNFKIIPDRREAVFEAIIKAQKNDIIIIAGKGHEDYQILPSGTIHFSDREQAEEAIKTRAK